MGGASIFTCREPSGGVRRDAELCVGLTGETEGEVLVVRRLLEKSEDDEELLFRLVGPECMGSRLVELTGVGAGISSVGRVIDLPAEREGEVSGTAE